MYNNKYDASTVNNISRTEHTEKQQKNAHTSRQNSLIWEKRLSLSLSCSRISQSKFHIPLIIPSLEFSTKNQPIQKHTNSWKKLQSTSSHARTVT